MGNPSAGPRGGRGKRRL